MELLVSILVFAVLSTLVAVFIRNYGAAQLKTETGTDVDRALSLTAARLETRLRGCRILSPAVGDTTPTLVFQSPQTGPDGMLVVSASGEPVWEPSREIVLTDGVLVVQGETQTTVGNLGPLGEADFERQAPSILAVTIKAGFEASDSTTRSSDQLSFLLSIAP